MVGIRFAESTVVNFTILGAVTARWDDDAPSLPPQQQLLLARLVYAGGKRVERHDLMKALSLSSRLDLPDGGLKRVVAELRAPLRSVMPDADPIPSADRGYRLVLDELQADVFRFRSKRGAALRSCGDDGISLMRGALEEWASDAAGLFGGCALMGLPGNWAAMTRYRLGIEYRDAVIYCLQQEMSGGQHHDVLEECERRGEASQADVAPGGHKPRIALLDEDFLEVWLRAAFRCGQPGRARQIGQWALEAAARYDTSADATVRRQVELVAAEESDGGAAFRAGPSATDQRPAMSTPATEEPAAMPNSGNTFTFNNANATIGQQIGVFNGSINNNQGSIQRRQEGRGRTESPGDLSGDSGDHET